MKAIIFLMAAACLCMGCSKFADITGEPADDTTQFVLYFIPQGQQYAQPNSYRPVALSRLAFTVKFDSSAIYHTAVAENQYDINKLYGFADNDANHHQYSARMGWRWSEDSLRLFAYVYNEGLLRTKELTTVPIGQEISCSITVGKDRYLFAAGTQTTTLPRLSKTENGKGYQLYPFFGGNEAAPHDIRIWIKKIAAE